MASLLVAKKHRFRDYLLYTINPLVVKTTLIKDENLFETVNQKRKPEDLHKQSCHCKHP